MDELEQKLDKHIQKHDDDYAAMVTKISAMWWKIALTILIPLVSGIFAYGQLTANVRNQDTQIQELKTEKASKETMVSYQENVLGAIGEVKADIKDLKIEIKNINK